MIRREAFAEASRFRGEFYECLAAACGAPVRATRAIDTPAHGGRWLDLCRTCMITQHQAATRPARTAHRDHGRRPRGGPPRRRLGGRRAARRPRARDARVRTRQSGAGRGPAGAG
ncbi:hypothetical protein EOT10_37155 [Streptomyces antnestii]|uniref:Uncharacterized protein n=1 Tax=Streptomyces antnestii TaxID=2494256 RepID=A0A437P2D5_9ACTN|nr:hypothetical protein EOT10_37155 [Streptomyces sp. San01]